MKRILAKLFKILKDDVVKVLHSICQQIWEGNSAVVTGLEKVSFHSNPKKGQCQRMFKVPHNCTHFICQQGYAQNPSKQASLVHELKFPDDQTGFQRGRGTRNQIANIYWIMEKAREFWKNIYFCFTACAKPFDCVAHNQLWKILKDMGIPDHLLTCLLRNLYAGQEATEPDIEELTGSKLRKAVYCHPAY